MEAPNEQVGYRACSRLLLRLVDCLMDASDLHLSQTNSLFKAEMETDEMVENMNKLDTWNESATRRAIGAIRDQSEAIGMELDASGSEDEEELFQLEDQLNDNDEDGADKLTDYLRTTRPMNWHSNESTKASDLQLDGGWRDAIKWLRKQLFSIKMSLQAGNRIDAPNEAGRLTSALIAFGHLERHLNDVSGQPSEVGMKPGALLVVRPAPERGTKRPTKNDNDKLQAANKQLALEFILETVEILAELRDEALKRQHKHQSGHNLGASKQLNEHWACDTIKRHYAYLTQIITTYNLLFNEIDIDLIGPSGHSSLSSSSASALNK